MHQKGRLTQKPKEFEVLHKKVYYALNEKEDEEKGVKMIGKSWVKHNISKSSGNQKSPEVLTSPMVTSGRDTNRKKKKRNVFESSYFKLKKQKETNPCNFMNKSDINNWTWKIFESD